MMMVKIHEDSNTLCRFLRKVCTVNILFASIIVTVCIVDIIITNTIKLQEQVGIIGDVSIK